MRDVKKLLLVVLVSILVFVLVVAYLMYSASHPPRNPPPNFGMGWDTTDTQGFEDVVPKAEDTGEANFTLAKGKTGIAVIFTYVSASNVKLWNGSFRIGGPQYWMENFTLPSWLNVTFDPAYFIVETSGQKARVRVIITASPTSPTLSDPIDIPYSLNCIPLEKADIPEVTLGSIFRLKII